MALTEEHKNALREIKDGADVFSYPTALRLREVQKEKPELLVICKIMGEYPVAQKRPYFGAILTAKGKAFIDK